MINYNGGCIVYKTRLGMRRNIIEKCILFLLNKNYRTQILKSLGSYDSMNDKEFLEKMFKVYMGYELDLNNPKTFNEKLQWLKLYDRNPEYTKMVDKYEVKNYVSSIIGDEYIIPTLGVWNKFKDIDFSKLPNQFVLKCTHDSGGLVICEDKNELDLEKANKKISKALKRDFYLEVGREWPYKKVPRKIICEQYIGKNPNDYKVFCFNGRAEYILVCSDRFEKLKETFFDRNWNIAPFKRKNIDIDSKIEKPKNLSKIIELSEKLSKNLPFLRVDFYDLEDKIYFGELTFFPASGFSAFEPNEWDNKLGEMIDLDIATRK